MFGSTEAAFIARRSPGQGLLNGGLETLILRDNAQWHLWPEYFAELDVNPSGRQLPYKDQAIVSTTPPSTRSAAPVVAEAWGDTT